jgi:D-alanyl-D-alanine carboxypeptidase
MQIKLVALASAFLIAFALHGGEARAEARLLIDAESGKVLESENAAYPWYPASVTKLMTTYVTFQALRDQRINLDTVFTYGPNAAAQQPSKMGFKVGTRVTVDNALKMLLVHSANDMAVVLAEGVSGSIAKFSAEMNANAQRLGMTQTHYVNPNGLPADEQVTSARDLAILARALLHEFPEYDSYWHIGAIRFGKRIMLNTNRLLDAYPGTDGMKTGFICASGFNLVASATRGGKRLIAVVLGAPSSYARSGRAAQMFERGFSSNPLSWLTPSRGTVDALVPVAVDPPNLREEVCGKTRHKPADDDEEPPFGEEAGGQQAFFLANLRGPTPKASELMTSGLASPPVDVFVGPANKPGSPAAALAATESPKRKTAAGAKPPAKPTAHAAIAPADPAAVGAPATKPVAATKPPGAPKPAAAPKPVTASKPAAAPASPAAPKPAAVAKPAPPKPTDGDKPKPVAKPKPAPKPAGTATNADSKPSTAGDKPKPVAPKPTVAAAKPKPAPTEAQ